MKFKAIESNSVAGFEAAIALGMQKKKITVELFALTAARISQFAWFQMLPAHNELNDGTGTKYIIYFLKIPHVIIFLPFTNWNFFYLQSFYLNYFYQTEIKCI